MPLSRSINNNNLIQSAAARAELYLYKQKFVNDTQKFSIYQKFWLNKENLEFLIGVFYDSELDEGRWGDHFNIDSISCSGTIYGHYYYQPPSVTEEITNLLLSLFNALYAVRLSEKREALDKLRDKFNTLAATQGSTRNPFELVEALDNRVIYSDDFIQIEYNISAADSYMRQAYENAESISNQIINDKKENLTSAFEPNTFIEDIMNDRYGVDALIAVANELNNPRDELAQANYDYRNTEYENAQDFENVDNAPTYFDAEDEEEEIRPSQHRYNLRNRARVDYSRFLNRTDRRNRRHRIARGLGERSFHIFKILKKYLYRR